LPKPVITDGFFGYVGLFSLSVRQLLTLLTLGLGLMINLGYPSNTAKSVIYLLITGVGIGGLFQTPLIALQAAMPPRDMATATGSLVLFRLLGSATGVAIGGTVLNNQLSQRLGGLTDFVPTNLEGSVQGLINLNPPSLRDEVLTGYAKYSPSRTD
jgi:hypothetical protein